MKFNIEKDLVSQSSFFKSRLDPVTLGGGAILFGGVGMGGGNLEKFEK